MFDAGKALAVTTPKISGLVFLAVAAIICPLKLSAQETTTTAVNSALTTGAPEAIISAESFGPADTGETSVTLEHGVMYQVLRPGTGPEAGTSGTLRVHYTLYMTNGKKLESSRDAELPAPLSMQFGQGDFVPGVEQALKGMKVGEVRRMYIPADQAYGAKGQGSVPPNTPLLFVMELVDIR